MSKNYIMPSIVSVEAEYERCIATSQAGTDMANGDHFQYEEEVDLGEYFDGADWQ